jgi:hypothetical protein
LLAIAWMVLLACLPWWMGLPWLLVLAAIQAARWSYLQPYGDGLRRALRWGLAGLLIASYRAFGHHALGFTLTMLAALVGFSLLVFLESWQDRRPQRNAALAAASPEWREMALAPIGPADTLIELQPPAWLPVSDDATDIKMIDAHRCCIGADARIDNVEPQLSMAPGQQWMAMPMTAWRGVVLYDRVHRKQYRLRGWQLYGWHAGEGWLSRSDDQPPLALSHVLGQDVLGETSSS